MAFFPSPPPPYNQPFPLHYSSSEIQQTQTSACEKQHRRHCERLLARLAWNMRRFLAVTYPDWIALLLPGSLIALFWFFKPNLNHVFPVFSPDGTIYAPELAYPHLDPIFSSAAAGALSATIPIMGFLVAQITYRSFADFGSAVLGLGYSLVTGTLFQLILKKTIGGFRPHFLHVCQPKSPPHKAKATVSSGNSSVPVNGTGYDNMMYTIAQVCTTTDTWALHNAMESFPSGHAEIAFAGFGFLSIYLFTHLKITSRADDTTLTQYEVFARYWRMALVAAPVIFATYLSSTLVLGYQHHAHDVIFGAFIGCVMAVLGYRMVFRGIWDREWNTEVYLRLEKRLDGRTGKDDRGCGGGVV